MGGTPEPEESGPRHLGGSLSRVAASPPGWWLASALAAVPGLVLLSGFTVDDAEISYAFADVLADGHPLGTLQPGEPVVAGFSNPTWTLLLAGAHRLGAPIPTAATVAAVLLVVATGATCSALIRRLTGRRGLALLGALVPLSYTVGLWSMSGLENSLVAFLVVLATFLLVREEQEGTTGLGRSGSALVVAVLAVSRPDAAVYVGAGALAVLLARPPGSGRRPVARRAGAALAWTAVPVGVLAAWLTWHTARFGYPLPNTVYAKVEQSTSDRVRAVLDPSSPVVERLGSFVVDHGLLLLLPLAALALARLATPVRTVALMALATFALPLAEVDWMAEYRFFATTVPLVVVLAAVGIDHLGQALARPRWRRPVAVLCAVPLALWAVLNLQLAVDAHRDRYPMQVEADDVAVQSRRLAADARRLGIDDPLIMTPDVGAALFRERFRVLDSVALVDPTLSHLMDDPEARDRYVFEVRRPDIVHTHGHWTRVYGLDWARMRELGYVPIRTHEDAWGQHGDYVRRDHLSGAPEE